MDKKLEKQLENFVKLQKTGNLTKQDANSILSLMETIEKEKIRKFLLQRKRCTKHNLLITF